ncbi:LysE family translocator [Gilvimarinus algae]|uniref:LysE family translocator n=1 Tax=Gilvimarinus algae TaxID=3058037 RepID=A0ABT8TFJ1_9GAMM|nr:LysE family translocator [Gilvimarinus sp. SDUM040014]MDO3382865.1 LysE family translocator [Gilvimarinus sp. SDUM040014]
MVAGYLLYICVALATIALPGPAVMLTLNNAVQRGLPKALAGIFGISLGVLLVALISASGLGVIIETSAMAFTVIKIAGAAYLIYLGLRMLRVKSVHTSPLCDHGSSFAKCFGEGFLVSVTNPKAVVFFISILPQFVTPTESHSDQLVVLSLTFSVLVVLVHTAYALLASVIKSQLMSSAVRLVFSRISGGLFISFGLALVGASR